jgi:hypothetical protein
MSGSVKWKGLGLHLRSADGLHEHRLRCLLSRPGPFQAQPLTAGYAPALLPRTGAADWLPLAPAWFTNLTPADLCADPGGGLRVKSYRCYLAEATRRRSLRGLSSASPDLCGSPGISRNYRGKIFRDSA